MPPADAAVLSSPPDLLSTVMDAIGACVYAKDRAGRYTFANEAMCHLMGCSQAQLVGSTAADHLDAPSAAALAALDRRLLETGEAVEDEESEVTLPDGRRRVFWTTRRPLRNAAGEITGLCGVSTDITERRQLERAMQDQRTLLQVVLNSLDAFIYMKGTDRRYRFMNQAAAADLGLRPEDVVGKRDVEILPPEWADKFWEMDREVFASGQKQAAEEMHFTPSGERKHHWSIKVPVRYEGAEALIGFSTDITELVRLREQLRQQAVTDPLTGLYNRRYFNDLAVKELARARRHHESTALLVFDIDHFKRINDVHGHPAGDEVLRRLARLLGDRVRTEDTLARMGGEEFLLLLPSTGLVEACLMAERLRESVRSDPDLLPGQSVTVSIGVVVSENGHDALDALYTQADARLYRAKQAGRDRVCADDDEFAA